MRFSEEGLAEFERICGRYPVRRSALIPTLQLAQGEFEYLSPPVIQYVAELLELSAMDVLSVTSFYEMLHTEPAGKRHIWVCHNLSCNLFGAEEIIRRLEERLGIRVGQTTKDGRFSLARAECLGACDKAPMLWCNDAFCVNLTPEKVDALIAEWKKEMEGGGAESPAGRPTPESRPAEGKTGSTSGEADGDERLDSQGGLPSASLRTSFENQPPRNPPENFPFAKGGDPVGPPLSPKPGQTKKPSGRSKITGKAKSTPNPSRPGHATPGR
ncbi:MAG: NADH-quinone oxidoreductase subunit NuoE [Nitrospinota bacterium]